MFVQFVKGVENQQTEEEGRLATISMRKSTQPMVEG